MLLIQSYEALVLSFVISLFITYFVIRFSSKLGILDTPRVRENHPATLHKISIPRGGGIPIFLTVLVASMIFIPFSKTLSAILAGGLLILGVGLIDDRKPVSPYLRLVINILAGILLVLSGISISFFTNPLGGILDISGFELLGLPVIAWGVTLVWIVALTNIVSWSSGVDGQLSGFVPIAAVTLGALSLRFSIESQWPVIMLSAIVAGGYLGLLFWSSFPQKIMPGYSGGALAGYLLGAMAILSGAKVATLLIVLGIPVVDAVLVIARRIASKKSPVTADAGHLHHRLLKRGWSKPAVSFFYSSITIFLGILVLHLNTQSKLYTIVMLVVLIGGLIAWLTFWTLPRKAR